MKSSRGSSDQEQHTDLSTQDWLFDAFCEPRTMPTGWDLSGMNGGTEAVRVGVSGESAAESAVPDESWPGSHLQYLNPFPEPRAYPVYWDLCR